MNGKGAGVLFDTTQIAMVILFVIG